MADHHESSDYVHGEMDIRQHEATYHLFNGLTKWISLHLAVLLVFLVILTCTKLGFIAAFVAAAAVAVAGFFFLKKKPAH
jgi:hypothetical protein